MNITKKLQELGYKLPETTIPAGSYLPYLNVDNLIFMSGQTPKLDGKVVYKGILGKDASIEDGQKAAEICILNSLSQLSHLINGNFSKLQQIVKLTVYNKAAPEFEGHAKVANGASDLLIKIFGEKGKHTRCAVGCSSLPSGSLVEIDTIFKIS